MMTDWNHSTPLAGAGAYAQAMIPLRVEGADPTNPALDTFEQVAVATVIAAAAYGSSAGQPISIDLFVNLTAHALPSAVTAFITGGFSNAGIGSGTYVADSLATSALAARCPLFCAADSTGRYFRLAARDRTIAISHGGAQGGANNDQPAVQAAINYAAAVGARTLLFDFDTVSLWNTVRSSSSAQTAWNVFAQDGQSIWVTAPIKFLGLPTGSHLKLLSTTGGSLETGWQNVGGNVWRGSGIMLVGGTIGTPNAYGLTFFGMENIWLDGGCAYTGVRTAPTPSSPDGADLANKGICLVATQCDAISLVNVKISGFKGESCYIAGTTQTAQYLRKVDISGSNQSAFNPSEGVVDAAECYFHDTNAGTESLGGIGGRWVACRIANTVQNNFTGGPANGLLYNYAYPTRVPSQGPPWLDVLSCDFQNAGQIIVGSYVRILDFTMTDSSFYLDTDQAGPGGNGSLTSCYLKGRYSVDQTSVIPICTIIGPLTTTTVIPGAPAGTYIAPPNDVHIDLDVHRTANAIANNYFAVAYSVQGYFDQNSCSLAVGKADGVSYLFSPNYGAGTITFSGAANGTNTTFTLSFAPPAGSLFVCVNGAVMASGSNYSISGTTLTFTLAPASAANIQITYFNQYSQPLVTMDGPTDSHLIGSGRPLGMYPANISAGPYALTVSNPRHSLVFTGAAAAIAITMVAPFAGPYGYAFGQKTRIYWDTVSTTGTTFTFAHNGTGLRLNSDCTLAVFGDWIEVEFNVVTGLWHESGRSIHAA